MTQKTVLITGCSSGIGLETVIECAKAGHRVFATMRNLDKKEKLEQRIVEEHLENIEIIRLDVSDSTAIRNTIASIVRKVNNIDVLFNNAGYMVVGSLEDLTLEEIRQQINTDLMGPIHLTKLALPHMQNGDEPGLVLNMSSVAGKIGFGLSSPYCISKFGIEGFTESLRREMIAGEVNVNVALIEAGIVHTKFFDNIRRTEASMTSNYATQTEIMMNVIDKIKNQTEWTHPEDIAKKVVEIIKEDGKLVRYVMGTDAASLINSVYAYQDNYERMDNAIAEIMGKYVS